jgi:hypothetical protein
MRLGREEVHQITGPSSYCLLLPPQDSKLPIQLLFGDVHRSFNNPCDEEDEKHTFKIYDEFLTVLDKVGKIYPVHFYTESAYGRFIETVKGLEDGYLFSRVVRKVTDCYDAYSYEDNCPTTYIKWNHVDARHFENSVEGYLYAYLREFLRKQSQHPRPIKRWLTLFEREGTFTHDINIWPSGLALSMFFIQFIVQYVETRPKIKDVEELSEETRKKLAIWAESRAEDLRKELTNRFDEESGVAEHNRTFLYDLMNYYFHSITQDNSSTARQLNKLQPTRGSNVSALKETLKRMPVDTLEDLKPALDQLVTVDVKVLKTIQKLLQVPPRTREDDYYEDIQMEDIVELQDACEKLLFFLDQIFSYLLDIFYIARMLQTKNSYLTVGYFGDNHTKKIANYLVHHLGYRLLTKSEDLSPLVRAEDISRCITLEDIDLDQILRQHLTDDRKKNIILHIKELNKDEQDRNASLRETFVRKYLPKKDPLPIWVEMFDELSAVIEQSPDRYSLARFLEPYLPLVGSRPLYSLYHTLRYNQPYQDALQSAVVDAKTDYRLERVLRMMIKN